MVFECQSCGGLLRLEEKMLPRLHTEGVVCPHCGRQGKIGGGRDSDTVDFAGESRCLRETNIVLSGSRNVSGAEDSVGVGSAKDPEIPRGSFMEGRTKTEGNSVASRGKNPVGIGWIKLAAVSLAVICLFALLVNLILPGPTGARLFGGVTVTESAPGR